MEYKVRIEPLGKEIKVSRGTGLHEILHDSAIEFACGGNGTCGKCLIKILSGNIEKDAKHDAALRKKGLDDKWRLACMSRITEDVTIHIEPREYVVESSQSAFDFVPEDGFGIAVDLGSTTIVSQLVNLRTSKIESVSTGINPQRQLGADIISRIAYAIESEEHRMELSRLVRDCIGQQIAEFGNHSKQVVRVSIVGNSVMHHLFSNIDVTPLATNPFNSPNHQAMYFTPEELGWGDLSAACEICFLPMISHFVGSDVLAGIYAVEMHRAEQYQLLIDLGTNGEIVIGNKDRIICTSTAAGPAFEGINISQGMTASTGAIYKVEKNDRQCTCDVIGGVPARGICGSGLIDAVYCLLKSDQMDFTGMFTHQGVSYLPLTSQVGLTINDIREFQLAKAAISAGIQLLLNKLGLTAADIENVYLAGGLGNYVNLSNAIGIGLLEFQERQLVKISNSALTGARKSLFAGSDIELENLRSRIEHYSLESDPNFQEIYCEKLFFPYDGNGFT